MGSSRVMTRSPRSLARLVSRLETVVDLPLPVMPVTMTSPWSIAMNSFHVLSKGKPISSGGGTLRARTRRATQVPSRARKTLIRKERSFSGHSQEASTSSPC